MEVVINSCFGGFGLSYEAVMEYARLKGLKLYASQDKRDANGHIDFLAQQFEPYDGKGKEPFLVYYSKKPLTKAGKHVEKAWWNERDIPRNDPDLIKVVGELKDKANGLHAELEIVQVPDDVEWEIEEYDGYEHVTEKHRTWP